MQLADLLHYKTPQFIPAMITPVIPEHYKGKKADTISEETFDCEEAAANHFQTVKQRFLNVNGWRDVAGEATANFSVFTVRGEQVNRPPQEGDYLRIEIPAPDNEAGEGADWVQVKRVMQNNIPGEQFMYMEVHPSQNPLTPEDETAHFFDEEASSTFIIRQLGNKVIAEVHGRNETPNNEDISLKDKIRNTLVAIGAMLGFSKIQWKSLTNGLVKKDSSAKGVGE